MPDINPTGDWMPLTLPQLDFWEEFTFHPDQPVSTVAHFIEIEGDVNEIALKRAIDQTIGEAEILSARFEAEEKGETPMQICDPDLVPELKVTDLRGKEDPLASARELMEQDLTAKLDLRHDKLSAHALYRVGDARYLWYIRAHHIIVDGYGLALIERRCSQLYNHCCGAGDAGLPFHSLASFLDEENRYQDSRQWQADRAFWTDYFSKAEGIEVLERGDEDYGGPGLHGRFSFPSEFSSGLRTTAAAVDIGWPDLLTLASGLYLYATLPETHKRTSDSLTLWLPFMSRWGSIGAHMPALLVNILPFRMQVKRSEPLADFLKRSAAELRQQRRHSRFRIEQISMDQGLAEGSRYFFSPLINVLPFNSPTFNGCRAQRHILGSGPADGFNLTFRGEGDGRELVLCLDADPALTGTKEFDRHEKELPSFLSRILQPDMLDRPVGTLFGETSSAARLETEAQHFPM
ncbi:condensation domain-containing protein [Roseibium marinum]|uniref:Enterobactin synthetase component F n=1 Tax=Roseibium marinum TaxID=281252 RepID=A0A2S3UNJ8_9HYPH|nr:condensation domain-containing protein [Roseibium marinum]POF29069.1 enterobactin synthetase component F [Roseibium marinum]